MSSIQVVLVVGSGYAACSFCGLGAKYGAAAHTKALKMKGVRRLRRGEQACGRRFTSIASSAASPIMAASIKIRYPDLEFLGSGEVVSDGFDGWEFKLTTPADRFKSK